METHTIAHWDHCFAFFKRLKEFDRRLVADLPCLIVFAVLPPDQTGDFALGVADEGRLGFDDLEKKLRIALREYFDPALIGGLEKRLITFAPESEDEHRVDEKALLAAILDKQLRIDLDL